MISPSNPALVQALDQIRRFPGEIAARQVRYGKIVICSPPIIEGGFPLPSRWVERARELGLIRPARVRRMPHAEEPPDCTRRADGEQGPEGAPRWMRLSGRAREVVEQLLTAGDDGCTVAELARAEDASGAFEELMVDLYRAGYASPCAALWGAK